MYIKDFASVRTTPLIILSLIFAADIVFTKDLCIGSDAIPYYFITVHTEPNHSVQNQRQFIESDYEILKEMVNKADEYNIKLTLMFAAQWVFYISESDDRLAEIEAWKGRGHEIAAHHHSISHENWDGFTNYSKIKTLIERTKVLRKAAAGYHIIPLPEKILGTLKDFIDILKKINPDINSGCVNEENDKNEMPDEIIYSTCSGYYNYGEPGRRSLSDLGSDLGASSEEGKNEYITTGIWKNIERKWLSHFPVNTAEKEKSAEDAFSSTSENNVYGITMHSTPDGFQQFYAFLEFLHSKDQEGAKSKTVTEIIEGELLQEKAIIVTHAY